VYAILIK
jgi:hypothetical protein